MRWANVGLACAVAAIVAATVTVAVTEHGSPSVPDPFAKPPPGSAVALDKVLCETDDGAVQCTRYVVLALTGTTTTATLIREAGHTIMTALGYAHHPDIDAEDVALEGEGYDGPGSRGAQVSDIRSALNLDAILFSGSNAAAGGPVVAAEHASPAGVAVRILG